MSITELYALRCDGCTTLHRSMAVFRYELRPVAAEDGWTQGEWREWMAHNHSPVAMDLCPRCAERALTSQLDSED